MEKYTKEEVSKYMLGDYIENIDELESNPEFMANVVCMDKKAYSLCSEEVRSNFIFVKKVIEKYKDDVEFATELYDLYNDKIEENLPESIESLIKSFTKIIESDQNDIEKIYAQLELLSQKYYLQELIMSKEEKEREFEIRKNLYELNILMRDITKKEELEVREQYVINVDSCFDVDQYEIHRFKEEGTLIDEEEISGLGFNYIQKKYDDSEIITPYVAKRYFAKIFSKDKDGKDLEDKIHQIFRKYEDFENTHKYDLLLAIIFYHDRALAKYIEKNPELLLSLDVELNRIKNNWDKYIAKKEAIKRYFEEQKYNRIIDRTIEYCEENMCDYDHYDYLSYVSELFGVKNELKRYVIDEKDIINIVHMEVDMGKISEKEGNKIIESNLEDIRNNKYENVDNSVLDNPYGIEEKNLSECDKHDIDQIINIFEEELGYTLEEKQKMDAQNKEKGLLLKPEEDK